MGDILWAIGMGLFALSAVTIALVLAIYMALTKGGIYWWFVPPVLGLARAFIGLVISEATDE